MNPLTDPIRRIDAAGVGVVLIVLAGGWFAFGAPVRTERQQAAERSAELGTLALQVEAAEAEADRLAERIAEFERLADDESIRARPVSDLNARLAELVAAAEAAGLRPRGVSPGVPRPDGSALRVEIRIDGQATYPALASLLDTLHTDHRDVTLGSVDLTRRGDGLAFDLTLIWWASPADGPTASAIGAGS